VTHSRSTGRRITVYLGESDVAPGSHRPLYEEIVRSAAAAGLAGASAIRGQEGFGLHRSIHTTRLLSMSEDLPVTVVLVDTPDKVEAFLPQLDALLSGGIVTVEDVELLRFAPADDHARTER
jgi:PII-like signaling protein